MGRRQVEWVMKRSYRIASRSTRGCLLLKRKSPSKRAKRAGKGTSGTTEGKKNQGAWGNAGHRAQCERHASSGRRERRGFVVAQETTAVSTPQMGGWRGAGNFKKQGEGGGGSSVTKQAQKHKRQCRQKEKAQTCLAEGGGPEVAESAGKGRSPEVLARIKG